jgi:NAD(P)-dependent dehydrogenase (short-subunit alcohol dehydrogenase family)
MLARSEDYLSGLTKAHPEQKLLAVSADISQPDEVQRAFAKVRDEFGPVDVLICHASASAWSGIEELTAAQFERSWRVTVFGAFLCCQEAARDMIARGRGVILFTGATSSIRGRQGALDFSSAKFGLRGFADSLARELWPKGIHVAHVIVDGVIGEAGAPQKDGDPMLDPRRHRRDLLATGPAGAGRVDFRIGSAPESRRLLRLGSGFLTAENAERGFLLRLQHL